MLAFMMVGTNHHQMVCLLNRINSLTRWSVQYALRCALLLEVFDRLRLDECFACQTFVLFNALILS